MYKLKLDFANGRIYIIALIVINCFFSTASHTFLQILFVTGLYGQAF